MEIENVAFSAEETAALRDQAAPEPATVPPAPAPAPAAPPAPPTVTTAEPAPQPAPETQTRNEGGQFDAEGRLVPLPELMKERDRRRELQDKFEASERQRIADMAKLSERLEALQRGTQPQPAEEDPMQRLQRVEQAQRQEQEQRRAAEAQERLAVEYQRKADEFGRDTPDFKQAYDHLMRVRAAEMAAAGVPQAQIPRMLVQAELQMAAHSLNEGVNPAQRLYGMARALGYTGAAPAAPAAAPAPSPAAADEAKRLATVQAGQAASASLATAGGTAPPALTLETLLSMEEDDFTKLATNPKAWRKAMGG